MRLRSGIPTKFGSVERRQKIKRDIAQPFHTVGVSSQNMNFRSFPFYRTAVEEKLFDGTVW
jgi:hypothetical protein